MYVEYIAVACFKILYEKKAEKNLFHKYGLVFGGFNRIVHHVARDV